MAIRRDYWSLRPARPSCTHPPYILVSPGCLNSPHDGGNSSPPLLVSRRPPWPCKGTSPSKHNTLNRRERARRPRHFRHAFPCRLSQPVGKNFRLPIILSRERSATWTLGVGGRRAVAARRQLPTEPETIPDRSLAAVPGYAGEPGKSSMPCWPAHGPGN